MTAQLQIDQEGLPGGEPGKARTDGLADGSLVTLTNTGSGSTTSFRLLWTPPGDSGDSGAVASLAPTDDPKVWSFRPTVGKCGSYLVELVENAGLGTERRERRVFGIRTPNLRLLVPALNERGDSQSSLVAPGSGEVADNNAVDYADGDLNALPFAAWWRAIHELIMRVDAGSAGSDPLFVTAVIGREPEQSLFVGADISMFLSSPNTQISYSNAAGTATLRLLHATLASDVWSLGFFGATPVERPSIPNVEGTQNQLNALIDALVALGLVTDDR